MYNLRNISEIIITRSAFGCLKSTVESLERFEIYS